MHPVVPPRPLPYRLPAHSEVAVCEMTPVTCLSVFTPRVSTSSTTHQLPTSNKSRAGVTSILRTLMTPLLQLSIELRNTRTHVTHVTAISRNPQLPVGTTCATGTLQQAHQGARRPELDFPSRAVLLLCARNAIGSETMTRTFVLWGAEQLGWGGHGWYAAMSGRL